MADRQAAAARGGHRPSPNAVRPFRLQYMPPSPYARKVLLCAHELGLYDQIEHDKVDIWGAEPDPRNPLGKIPVLLTPGIDLPGSSLICEYLISIADDRAMLPAGGRARWRTLQMQALADGIVEAAVARKLEERRPAGLVWRDWMMRQEQKVIRGLDYMEASPDLAAGGRDLGHVALAAALGYLDLRTPDLDWRQQRPRLASFLETFARRPSFAATDME